MESLPHAGADHPEKVPDILIALKTEIKLLSESIKVLAKEEEMTRKLSESFLYMHKQLNLLESEYHYFMEVNNCRSIMLTDYLEYIKKLEQQVMELKQ